MKSIEKYLREVACVEHDIILRLSLILKTRHFLRVKLQDLRDHQDLKTRTKWSI
jgi:hypothetical protein